MQSSSGTVLLSPTPILARRATSTASMSPPPVAVEDDLDCRQPRDRTHSSARRRNIIGGSLVVTVNGDIETRIPFSNANMGDGKPLQSPSSVFVHGSPSGGKPPLPSPVYTRGRGNTVDGFTAYLLQKHAIESSSSFVATESPLERSSTTARTCTPDSLDERFHGDGCGEARTKPLARRLSKNPAAAAPVVVDVASEEEADDGKLRLVQPTVSKCSTMCSMVSLTDADVDADPSPVHFLADISVDVDDPAPPSRQASPSPLEAFFRRSCGVSDSGDKGNVNPSVPLLPRASSFHPPVQPHRTLSPSISTKSQ
jgi:hypothetical protein